MEISVLLSVVLFSAFVKAAKEIDYRELRCLVCRSTIDELQHELRKVDPAKKMDVGSFRLDADGNAVFKKVPLASSEIHISETLDKVCAKFDNYIRATHKSSGRLTLLNLFAPAGGMNPDMSKVEIIQDEDLNKSLRFLCELIVEEFEESIISGFQTGSPNVRGQICTEEAKFCDDDVVYEEKDLENEEQSSENNEEESSDSSDKTEL
ncbi:protein seele [Belonocnema kinseyi]|uniref:protein seele n=1 Tax=Belonocnema kinseyi TaxID=2817044 RepID=UPI00143D3836|nr:protein seele [Belonocnema kinseyi]XP_033219422.1 protein seele [Belonocnema kinseyi]